MFGKGKKESGASQKEDEKYYNLIDQRESERDSRREKLERDKEEKKKNNH